MYALNTIVCVCLYQTFGTHVPLDTYLAQVNNI
jgi:hypothetical protein